MCFTTALRREFRRLLPASQHPVHVEAPFWYHHDVDIREFPNVDRGAFAVGSVLEPSNERFYWLSKTPCERLAAVNILMKASWFAQRHKVDNNWWYAGGGVKLGEADKAICWWKQKDSTTYRVVYGNLHIGDANEMPQSP
jgi:hypothetical protein